MGATQPPLPRELELMVGLHGRTIVGTEQVWGSLTLHLDDGSSFTVRAARGESAQPTDAAAWLEYDRAGAVGATSIPRQSPRLVAATPDVLKLKAAARARLRDTARYRELLGGGGARDWLDRESDRLTVVLVEAMENHLVRGVRH